MKYNSDVLICNMNIKTVLHILLFAVHIFQISFLAIPQITWDQKGQLLIFTCFIFWLLHCWSSQLDMEKTKSYLSNVLIVGISQHFIVGDPWVGTCVGQLKKYLGVLKKKIFLKEYLN